MTFVTKRRAVVIRTRLQSLPKTCHRCPYFTKTVEEGVYFCWARHGQRPINIQADIISSNPFERRWYCCPLQIAQVTIVATDNPDKRGYSTWRDKAKKTEAALGENEKELAAMMAELERLRGMAGGGANESGTEDNVADE